MVEALRRTDELGMPPIRAKAKDLLDRIDAARALAPTPRELEVSHLIVGGADESRDRVPAVPVGAHRAEHTFLDKLTLANRSQIAVWVQGRELSSSVE